MRERVKSDFDDLFPEKIEFDGISRSILLKIESVGLPILFKYGRSRLSRGHCPCAPRRQRRRLISASLMVRTFGAALRRRPDVQPVA